MEQSLYACTFFLAQALDLSLHLSREQCTDPFHVDKYLPGHKAHSWDSGTSVSPSGPLDSMRGSAPSPLHVKKQEEALAMPQDIVLHPCSGTGTVASLICGGDLLHQEIIASGCSCAPASQHCGEGIRRGLVGSRSSTNRMCQLNFSQHLLTLTSQQKASLGGEGLASVISARLPAGLGM